MIIFLTQKFKLTVLSGAKFNTLHGKYFSANIFQQSYFCKTTKHLPLEIFPYTNPQIDEIIYKGTSLL